MGQWQKKYFCAVVAICCALVGPSFSAPTVDVADGTIRDGAQATSSSASSAFESVLASLRYKRQTAGQCMELGGYCRYHEDCCSRLCLSFSYKCVTRPHQSIFTPTVTQGQNTGAQDVVNRFGDSNSAASGGSSAAPGGGVQCREVGGYCSRGSECCSGLCLSFSYKCVNNPNRPNNNNNFSPNINGVFELGQSIPRPEGEISLEELVNRFGGPEDNTLSTNSVASPTGTMRPTVFDTTSSSSIGRPTNLQCTSTGGECNSSNECCSRLCVRLGGNSQLCAEQVQQQHLQPEEPPVTTRFPAVTTIQVQCLDIGAKCYGHSECCSSRCHMFLHQCVT